MGRPENLSPIKATPSRASSPIESSTFRFLALPIELRHKIYSYLLPPRIHIIQTDTRSTGHFYNSSFPSRGLSTDPFGRSPPAIGASTPYRVLSTNSHANFPVPSIYPQILSVCKRIHREAEQVLYGGEGVVFDFRVYGEALIAFMSERSKVARACVTEVRLAKELHHVTNNEIKKRLVPVRLDGSWLRLCEFMRSEMGGVRALNLCLWSCNGSLESFPDMGNEEEGDRVVKEWRKWEWTKTLLELESLRIATITIWNLITVRNQAGERIDCDSWVAQRMLIDSLARDRMIKERVIEERIVVVPGNAG